MRRNRQNTAYWTQRTHLLRADEYKCSRCRRNSPRPYYFCPVCGAAMVAEKYNASWVDKIEAFDILLDD